MKKSQQSEGGWLAFSRVHFTEETSCDYVWISRKAHFLAKNHVCFPSHNNMLKFLYRRIQLNLCETATLKKTENWYSRPIIALLQVKSFAECSYFCPSLSYLLSLRSLFLSGRLHWFYCTQFRRIHKKLR